MNQTYNFTFNNLSAGVNYSVYITAVDSYMQYPMRMYDDYLIVEQFVAQDSNFLSIFLKLI